MEYFYQENKYTYIRNQRESGFTFTNTFFYFCTYLITICIILHLWYSIFPSDWLNELYLYGIMYSL